MVINNSIKTQIPEGDGNKIRTQIQFTKNDILANAKQTFRETK